MSGKRKCHITEREERMNKDRDKITQLENVS